MYITSAAYKTQIKEPGHFPLLAMEVHFADLRTLSLTSADFMESDPLTVSRMFSNTNVFEIGVASMKKLTGTLNNNSGKFDGYDFTGAVLYPQRGLTLTDTTVEYIDLGIFTIDQPVEFGKTIPFSAVDRMYKFEKSYSVSTLVYPATIADILDDLCTITGVVWDAVSPTPIYGTGAFTNSDVIVQKSPAVDISFTSASGMTSFAAAPTCRELLGMIAMLANANAFINHDGQLTLRSFFETVTPYELDTYKSCEIAKNDFVISGIQYAATDATKVPTLYGDETGAVYSLEDNLLLDVDNYDAALTTLALGLCGLTFRPFVCDAFADFSIDGMDTVNLTVDGTVYTTILSNVTHKHFGGSSYSAEAESIVVNKFGTPSLAAKMRAVAARQSVIQLTAYEEKMLEVSSAIATAKGFYETRTYGTAGEILELYYHDHATLATSVEVTKFTSDGIGQSHNGGVSYSTVLSSTGITAPQLVARLVIADMGIFGTVNANLIIVGAATLMDTLAGLQASIAAVSGGGTNFIQNSAWGTYDDPSLYWWYLGLTWQLLELRIDSWTEFESNIATWTAFEAYTW